MLFTVVVLGANGLLRYRQLYVELSRSEAWMRALLTTTVDGVITIDRDGTVEEFNASAEKIFGWKRDDIVGGNIRLLMTDAERNNEGGLLGYLRDSSAHAAPNNAEVEAVRRDGSLVPIRVAVGHARMDERELFVCFVTDITERREMVAALRASESQFRSLIGNIPGVSYRSRIEGAHPMVFISDAVERVAGYPAHDFVGKPPGSAARRCFGALIHAADRVRVSEAIAAALAEDRPYLVEYRLLHADGSTRWLWENGTGVRNEAGVLTWLDGVILDISERRTMEDALRQAKEAAEQAAAARASFVANMSHEIRTPMNSILGFTDVLLDGELAPDQRRHLDTVRSNGRSLLRLLNEILDTAKLEKGAVELEVNDFNLLSLIDELSSTLAANARTKGLQVDIHYDPALPTNLRGDELRIRQVLTNLLDNAIKFTAAGTVRLSAEQQDGMLHFSVKDTGIGIAPERLQAIFDPFTQADASMTRRFGGTGLGTTISKQLVELMGGKIWAESVIGAGTTFHVVLPLVVARFAPQQARVRTAAALPPLRVLAADDVPQNLELLQLLLARRGHTLTGVADGAAVVEMAARQEFDLVLMDFQMPVLDGLAATRRIREQEAGHGPRAHSGDRDDGQRAGRAPPRQPRSRHGRLRLEAGRLGHAVARNRPRTGPGRGQHGARHRAGAGTPGAQPHRRRAPLGRQGRRLARSAGTLPQPARDAAAVPARLPRERRLPVAAHAGAQGARRGRQHRPRTAGRRAGRTRTPGRRREGPATGRRGAAARGPGACRGGARRGDPGDPRRAPGRRRRAERPARHGRPGARPACRAACCAKPSSAARSTTPRWPAWPRRCPATRPPPASRKCRPRWPISISTSPSSSLTAALAALEEQDDSLSQETTQ